MATRHHPPEFKADAVALYQSRPEATIRQVAASLGIDWEIPRNWVRAVGTSRPPGRRTKTPTGPPTPLEAENATLRTRSAATSPRPGAYQGTSATSPTFPWPTGSSAVLRP
ncbi:transposase [Streptomyces sp. NPDC017991]|uniref:transposase n=1 Tax=Streptomyces sp. NPDC017991 TaxID=3365026 RepID=UPI0037BBBD74